MESFDMESHEKREEKKSSSSSTSTFLIVVIIALTVSAVVMSYFLYTFNKEDKTQLEENNRTKLCLSSECLASADRIISSMNASVDPCDDFFEFTCGGYIDTHPITDSGAINHFKELDSIIQARIMKIFEGGKIPTMPASVIQMIDFYEKCIDTETHNKLGLEPIFERLESLGLPRIPMQNNTPASWPDVMIRGNKLMAVTPFFLFKVDIKNETSYLILRGSQIPLIPIEILYEPFFVALNENLGGEYVNTTLAAQEVVYINRNISELPESNETEPILMTVAELQDFTDQIMTGDHNYRFDWEEFLRSFLEDSYLEFDMENDQILVPDLEYLSSLFELLNNTPPETLELYTWFYYFHTMAPYSTEQLRAIHSDTNVVCEFFGCKPPDDEQVRCSGQVRKLFFNPMVYAYLDRYFDQEQIQKTELMVKDIEQAFIQIVKGADWMDDETKNYALEKLHAVKPNIGYPDWLFVPGELDKHNLLLEYVRGDWMTMNTGLSKVLRQKFDPKKADYYHPWHGLSSLAVNAAYSNYYVSIFIPAGILHAPFADNGLESLNYGAIGAIIGHEITHGFDYTGSTYNKEGIRKNWWSNDTLENFIERVLCMMDQYNNIHIPELGPNATVKGNYTINENIADNGGLREALLAYDVMRERRKQDGKGPEPLLPGLANYSQKQLFFLGFANVYCGNYAPSVLNLLSWRDDHSPSRARVLGTLSNTKEFAEAWNCPAGSKMNPVDKCVVW